MRNEREAFLKIMVIELEDLQQDIELLIKEYNEQFQADKLSNYVFLQNVALMQNELFGVNGLHDEIATIDPGGYPDLTTMIADFEARIVDRMEQQGIPPSFQIIVERKIQKVKNYISHCPGG